MSKREHREKREMSEWRSATSQLLSNERGAAEVSISVSWFPGFRLSAIPGARATFPTEVPTLLCHLTHIHTYGNGMERHQGWREKRRRGKHGMIGDERGKAAH